MPPLSRYRLVDFATQGYLLFVAVVALALRREHWAELAIIHCGVLAAVHLLIASVEPALARGFYPGKAFVSAGASWLREFYPILLYAGLYVETVVINRMVALPRLDPWLLEADHALFGCEPRRSFRWRSPIRFGARSCTCPTCLTMGWSAASGCGFLCATWRRFATS
jgi:hypothetical protein